MVSLRQLRHFSVLADTLHFTRAAERLGIAQPPLSQSIKALEREIGCELIIRRPVIRLTEAGELLLEHARRILRDVDATIDDLKGIAEGRGGRIRIGFATSTLAGELPAILRRFRERYPEVQIELRGCRSIAQIDQLLAGAIDVGIMREAPEHPGVVRHEIASDPFVLAAPGEFEPLSRGVFLRDLREREFILFPEEAAPGLRGAIDRLFHDAGFQPRVAQLAREWFTIVGLVEAGGGMSIVPRSFLKLRWGNVRYHDLLDTKVRTVTSLCHARNIKSVSVDHFVEIARRASL